MAYDGPRPCRRPTLRAAEYEHGCPMLAQRLHTGFWLSQRTFDAEHISHEFLSFGGASAEDAAGTAAEAVLLDMISVPLHR